MTPRAMEHTLFVYGEDEDLAGQIGAFLSAGVQEASATIMVVDGRKSDILRETLGSDRDHVQVIDCTSHYSRPEAAVADYDVTLRRLIRDGSPSVRLFGELPEFRTTAEYAPWVAYEAILNRAFAHHPVSIVCGYDTRVVPDEVVEAMHRTHPRVLGGSERGDPAYEDPAAVVAEHSPLTPVSGRLEPIDTDGDAAVLRRRVRRRMLDAGLSAADSEALLLASSEVIANAQTHGGGVRELRFGSTPEGFVLEVSDAGPGLASPLAGHLPPGGSANEAAGLWVARQVTKRLEMLGRSPGLTVRLWI
jgi:anti-sigma regulatory factor (Ser/Thr protein kinase)